MTRCVIVDDEPLAIDILETYLSQLKEATLVATFTDSVEAFSFLQHNQVDVVFLDLHMPLLNGMELVRNLTTKPAFIITTAYREYAVEGFELDVVDYLVKPIAFPRFLKAINKVMAGNAPNAPLSTPIPIDNGQTLWLKVDKKLVPVTVDSILYIESLKDYIRVVTPSQKLVSYHSLQAILDKLTAAQFVRIHKSYAVQVTKVNSIEGNMVHIANEVLPIGRSFRSDLMARIEGKR
jgi:two-component system, LytTR family, response regulator